MVKLNHTKRPDIYNPMFAWHAKAFKLGRKNVVLLVNDASKYTVCLYGIKKVHLTRFNDILLSNIKDMLLVSGLEESLVDTYIKLSGESSVGTY